jgi:hypothetical protein
MVEIIDLITGETIGCKNMVAAQKEANRRLRYHNSSFAYSHRGFHYPQNAYLQEYEDKIIIKKR